MRKKTGTSYLLKKHTDDHAETETKKEMLIQNGHSVITIIEGPLPMEKGLQALISNHTPSEQ